MKIIEEEKAQGATEYLLMLAGVLAVVAISIDYVISLGKNAKEAAADKAENIFDNLR